MVCHWVENTYHEADRTPKQKQKFRFSNSGLFVDLLGGKTEELVLKKPQQLEKLLTVAYQCKGIGGTEARELQHLIQILEMKGEKAGTKVQIRPSFSGVPPCISSIQLIVVYLCLTIISHSSVQKWGGLFTECGILPLNSLFGRRSPTEQGSWSSSPRDDSLKQWRST